jgi:hypothetical protein
MPEYRVLLYALLFASTSTTSAADSPQQETEAMELGGLLTVDGANRIKDWENTPAQLGSMELSANVNIQEGMQGSISLLSESDPEKIVVDQAVGQWTLERSRIVFGYQGFNMGLHSTRTISDPLTLEVGEFRQAGVTGLFDRGRFSYGLGLSSISTLTSDSIETSDPCLVLNADFAPEGRILRASLLFSRIRQAVDAGANLTLGTLRFDLEGIWRWKDPDNPAMGGYAAGIAWLASPQIQPALRLDGAGKIGNLPANRIVAIGITAMPVEHVFGAGEISFDQDGESRFALQMGLQSSIKLPGFQRRTLTK